MFVYANGEKLDAHPNPHPNPHPNHNPNPNPKPFPTPKPYPDPDPNPGEKLDGEWNGSAYPDYGIYTYANGDRYGQ